MAKRSIKFKHPKKTKLYYSQKAHAALSEKHNDVANMSSDKNPKCFYSIVKRDYHDRVAAKQFKEKKIISKDEKKKIYNDRVRSLARYNNWANYHHDFGRYVPKKYRHLEASDAAKYDSMR